MFVAQPVFSVSLPYLPDLSFNYQFGKLFYSLKVFLTRSAGGAAFFWFPILPQQNHTRRNLREAKKNLLFWWYHLFEIVHQ